MKRRSSPFVLVSAGAAQLSTLTDLVCELEAFLHSIDSAHRRHGRRTIARGLKRAFAGPTPLSRALIIEHEGRAQGYALFNLAHNTTLHRPEIYVHDFFIREEVRRAGLGRALLDGLKAVAHKEGCGSMVLTVWNLNPRALGFYLAQGAKPLDDEIIMEWSFRGKGR